MLNVGFHLYLELYASPVRIAQPFEISAFTDELPSISREDARRIDRLFDVEELKSALDSAAKCSTPGLDGITYQLLRCVWEEAGSLLVEVVNGLMYGVQRPRTMVCNLIILISRKMKRILT